MKKIDFTTIIISFSLVLVISLSTFLFLNFFKVNLSIVNKNDLPAVSNDAIVTATKIQFPVNSYPVHEFTGILTKLDGRLMTINDIANGIAIIFTTDGATKYFVNETKPPYESTIDVTYFATTPDRLHIGDQVRISVTEDLRTPPTTTLVSKEVTIVRELSRYLRGTVSKLDINKDSITVTRNDDIASNTSVIISLTNIKKIVLGYKDEPDMMYGQVTKNEIQVGQDILVYSDTPIPANATTVNSAYLKLTSPGTRPQ